MRSIKFKAISAHCDKWCYGNLVVYEEEKWESEIVGFDVYKEGRSEWMEEKIEYDTICQFTGLYDKNGKEIYEGDIVKCDVMNNEEIFCVTWLDGKARFALTESPEDTTGWLYAYDVDTIEVWGNIYDNLELLKGGIYGND